ncbi:MAG TPA: response regulator [Thermoanaerobaculaceae bacterium]|nr:response regulator [Thermoanaerobaculaceae bacterium]HRS16930.1 response regulator [Thermoanaerobaculaceae bacterium]
MIGTPIRVLVVDDDPIAVEIILEYLDGMQVEATTAHDGQAGWEALEARPGEFDVVLLDRMMPRLNGIQLLQRIRADVRFEALPVILQTSASDQREVLEGIQAGAYYYLTKPFRKEMLRSIVRAAASDFARVKALREELRKQVGVLNLLRTGRFEFRTLNEAMDLGAFLARAFPDPDRVLIGLSELLVNAVEHGNLELSYEDKGRLEEQGTWREEIERRLADPTLGARLAEAELERRAESVTVTIRDQGRGFDPEPYLRVDPARLFDTHGRGILIAKTMSFDELQYRDRGREVVAVVKTGPVPPPGS